MPKDPDYRPSAGPSRIGGSFAPPIDDKKLAKYRELAEEASRPVKEAMLALCDMVEVFRQTPTSPLPGFPHMTGQALIVPLETAEVARIDPVVPWKHELDMYATLFDSLSPKSQKAVRDAAFHLLWFGYELYQDREPLTTDRLRPPAPRTPPTPRTPKVK